MQQPTKESFGLLIAYLLPGYVVLACLSNTFAVPFETCAGQTIGQFLNNSTIALGLGMILSTVRWLSVDAIHRWTGVKSAGINTERLGERLPAFLMLVEQHYRYYQFYSNSFVAVVVGLSYRLLSNEFNCGKPELIAGILAPLLFFASRDTLVKYYSRTEALLS